MRDGTADRVAHPRQHAGPAAQPLRIGLAADLLRIPATAADRAGAVPRSAAETAFLAIAESYFDVQQMRGKLAGAEDAVRRTIELVRRGLANLDGF